MQRRDGGEMCLDMATRSYLLMQKLRTWILDGHHTPCEDDWFCWCVLLWVCLWSLLSGRGGTQSMLWYIMAYYST